jgi:integrase
MASKGSKQIADVIEDPKGSDRWWARVYFQGRRYKRRAASKSHARALYHELKTLIRKGEFPPKPQARPACFDELLSDYREAKLRERKAVMKSEIGYRRLLDRFGGRRADTITAAEVEQWRDEMRNVFAPATVNLHLAILRATLRLAVRNRKLDASAVPAIRGLKANNTRVRYLTDDEESRLMAALPEWLIPLITVAIHTGMRRGELLKLAWDDVDFVSGTIHVREAKSGEGRRIPMSATAHRTLSALWQARRKRLSARVVSQSAGHRSVFTAERGGFLLNLGRAWYPALERAGISDLHFHDLRHTFASRLVMNGVDLYPVQTLMGHKTPAMTLRYAHLSPQHLRAAVATLDAPGPKPWAAERRD